MTPEEVIKFRDESNKALAGRGTLLLTVRLDTPEQADEIFQWMYSNVKPMSSTLVEIAWDKVAVPKEQAEALETIKRTLR